MTSLRTVLALGTFLMLGSSALQAQGGQVTCSDGSRSAGGRGACSGHGGIMTAAARAKLAADARAARSAARQTKEVAKADAKLAKSEARADAKAEKRDVKMDAKDEKRDVKMDAKAERDEEHEARGATAECRDHTYSHAKSHQGACSRHGGVQRFLGR